MIVRRIAPASLGRVMGAIYGLLGVVIAIPFALVVIFIEPGPDGFGGFSTTMGLLLVLFYPVLLGVGGLVIGLISGTLYNVVAGRFGGIELELESDGEARPTS